MVNSVVLQGRLTADIELRYTQSSIAHAEFTVAWSEKYKDTESKCFMRCKAWRSTAEFLEKYFKKGQEIAIQGKMLTEQWEKDGNKKSRMVCLVDKVNFCGSKGSRNPASSKQNSEPQTSDDGFMNIPDGIDDDFPF